MTLQASLYVALRKLPDFVAVGGNARFANPGHRISVFDREREEWKVALRAAQAPQFDQGAFFNGPVELRATLHFPTASRPDYENAVVALKTLVDLFEPFSSKVRTARQSKKQYTVTKGMLGWIANDRLIVWPWLVRDETRSAKAPLTEIELRAVGHEQRALV